MDDQESGHITIHGFESVREAFGNDALTRSLDHERFEIGNLKNGTVSVLDGEEHRERRRILGRLFRREMFEEYERKLFPGIVDQVLSSFVDPEDTDLVEIAGLFTVVLAARTAGIDFDDTSIGDRRRLRHFLHEFARGTGIDTAVGDPADIIAEVQQALAAFKEEYLDASWRRRADLLRRFEAGAIAEAELPLDVLTTLLRHQEELGIDDDHLTRETVIFFTAGANTSIQTMTNTVHLMLDRATLHPEEWERAKSDLAFVQRCVHEAVRLRPTNPIIARRALTDTEVGTIPVPADTQLTFDMISANHDPSVYGTHADSYDPLRALAPGSSLWGLSFGHGSHACMGRTLAAGMPQGRDGGIRDEHLFGLIPIAVQALVRRNIRRQPDRPPQSDSETRRWTRWKSYPVALDSN